MHIVTAARRLLLALTMFVACHIVQAQTITQRFNNEPLRKVIHDIERQTHMSFIYKADVIDEQLRVSIHCRNTPIKTVLRTILPPDISFIIEKKLIILYRKADNKSNTSTNTPAPSSAPPFIVQGRVLDQEGLPVLGATVIDPSTRRGTVTDADGLFTLNVSPQGSIHISYIGYESANVPVRHRLQLGTIVIREAVNKLNEVVVIGYGTTRKQTLTGAVDKLRGTDVSQQPVSTLTEALQGLSPNLTIQRRSANPNALVNNINIRGISTLNSNAPLVVVDGMVCNDDALSNLNMNDIDNISVLKDAGAAAIYGSRSSNGVVLITTRKGKLNERPSVKLTSSVGWQTPHLLYEPVAGWRNAEMRNESYKNVGGYIEFTDEQIADLRKHQSEEQWFMREIFRTALQQNYNVSVSGGTDKATYMVSAGYFDQASNYVGNKNYGTQRYNLRSNVEMQAGRLNLQALLSFVRENDLATTGTSLERDASRVPPYYYYKMKANGKYLLNDILSEFNPLGSLEAGGTDKSRKNDFTANVTANLDLGHHLSLKGVVGVNVMGSHRYSRQFTVPYYTNENQSEPTRYDRQRREVNDQNADSYLINTQLLLNYERQLQRHHIKALLGISNESTTRTTNSVRLYYANADFGTTTGDNAYVIPGDGTTVSPEEQTRTSISSVLGRVTYNWANRYISEFDFRYDGTSKFANAHRWSFFPSISAAWLVTDEPFLSTYRHNVGHIKLRTSYGVLGNQSINAYDRFTRYILYNNTYAFNNKGVTGAGFTLGSDNLRWERTQSFNIGLDATFLHQRLNLGFNWFYKNTNDILMRPEVATVFGTNAAITNIGRMSNQGWELSLQYRLKSAQTEHTFAFNMADTRNRLRSLPEQMQISSLDEMWIVKKVGAPIHSYYGYRTAGIFQSEAEIADAALPVGAIVYPGDVRYVDRDGNGIINSNDRYVLGNAFPRYTFGFTYTFAWKGFDASIFINGVGKRDMMVRGELVEPFFGNYAYAIYKHQTDYWTPSNPNSKRPRLAAQGSTSENNNYRIGSDIYIFNAAYARLKNITIGYTLPPRLTRALHIQRCRLYLTGQNLLTLSPTSFIDPESSEFDSSMTFGASNTGTTYPPLRYWGMGFDIDF